MKRLFLLLTLITLLPHTLSAQTTTTDSTWVDSLTGTRRHLQLLSPNDTLALPKQNMFKPLVETLGINLAVWSWDHFLYDRRWADIDIHTIRRNLRSNFVLDYDSYSGNQFSHPFHGSMFFNAARHHGNNYWLSMAYPLIGSMTWEYFCERNPPSFNDFLSTGIGGAVIGEATHRASDIIFDNTKTGFNRVLSELAGSLLNPARGVHRLVSGEAWRVSHSRGKRVQPEPFTFDVGLGYRGLHEMRGQHRDAHLGYLDFQLDYGDRYRTHQHPAPFDYFRVHLLINLAAGRSTFSDLDIRGRLLSHQWSTPRWNHDFGLHQVYRYIDNYGEKNNIRAGQYPCINEACSFGLAWASQHRTRRTLFDHELLASGIVFGGTTADYFMPRSYDFAQGFSLRDELHFSFLRRCTLGNDFYFARMFVPKGSPDPYRPGDYYWGDQGNNSIFLNRSYLRVGLTDHLRLNAEYALYYRRSNYKHYHNVHAKSTELKVGLLYAM